jgi:hypothetical protein
VELGSAQERVLEVFDAQGRRVYGQRSFGDRAQLDLRHLATGPYVLRSSSDAGSAVQRFVIE